MSPTIYPCYRYGYIRCSKRKRLGRPNLNQKAILKLAYTKFLRFKSTYFTGTTGDGYYESCI
ncbi:hypothetical protein, partial [Romboutsia ilealis]|uniref:hypothetical protein n=1 Tax=Romboutsia ilealis TaxID=1115758 RepID=UPI00272B5F7D